MNESLEASEEGSRVAEARQRMVDNTCEETINDYQDALRDAVGETHDAVVAGTNVANTGMQGKAGVPTSKTDLVADSITTVLGEINE